MNNGQRSTPNGQGSTANGQRWTVNGERLTANGQRLTANGQRFHEWPLVVFTTLAILGAGLLTSPLVAALLAVTGLTRVPTGLAPSLLPGLALLAAGLVVSLAHLGRPLASPRAVAGTGRSRLSAEIVLAGATLGCGALALALGAAPQALVLLASACALAFLLALGLVYDLPGQVAWRGSPAAGPLVLGVGFGLLALDRAGADIAAAGPFLVGLDLVLFLARGRQTLWPSGGSSVPRGRESAVLLLAARIVLVDVLPAALAARGLPAGAAGALGLGILVDRLAFYLLAVQHTTEREIARVEDVIADL